MFCFPNTGHVIVLFRTVSFKFRLVHVHMYVEKDKVSSSPATGTGRPEHVDVFLCASIKSLIFFLSFYVMS